MAAVWLVRLKPSWHTRFQRAITHAFAFSKKLRWFESTKVISLKTRVATSLNLIYSYRYFPQYSIIFPVTVRTQLYFIVFFSKLSCSLPIVVKKTRLELLLSFLILVNLHQRRLKGWLNQLPTPRNWKKINRRSQRPSVVARRPSLRSKDSPRSRPSWEFKYSLLKKMDHFPILTLFSWFFYPKPILSVKLGVENLVSFILR